MVSAKDVLPCRTTKLLPRDRIIVARRSLTMHKKRLGPVQMSENSITIPLNISHHNHVTRKSFYP
jgi:hypothetical protein